MTASVLRDAATAIRLLHGDDAFYGAVAEWLEATADGLDARGVTAHVKPAEHAALKVARAYLGVAE